MSKASPSLSKPLSADWMRRARVCPLDDPRDGRVRIAVAPSAHADAAFVAADLAGAVPDCEAVTERDLDRCIERLWEAAGREGVDALLFDDDVADLRDMANEPPIVRWVNALLQDAIARRASDVHLDLRGPTLSVRFRVDGLLGEIGTLDAARGAAALSRLKLLASLDIAERRRPQDGRMRVLLDGVARDVRVATLGTHEGESVVCRILERYEHLEALADLGMPADIEVGFRRMISQRGGLVLVCGPTGCGKTTTVFAALSERQSGCEKIITVEDPVEFTLPGVTQVPVPRDDPAGFSDALRAVLRHDPDVLFIGEVRDGATARVAVQAALTGHLVLATVHTVDAPSAVARLLDLGAAPEALSMCLIGALGQRLVRRRCACGGGCSRCADSGYRGRIGVFELLSADMGFKAVIARQPHPDALRAAAGAAGWRTLADAAQRLVTAGLTTREEVHRVLA
jgi:general secretion pathway protein E